VKNLFELKFDTDNAAFADNKDQEVQRILNDIANDVLLKNEGTIRDINGNKIGTWKLT